MGQPVAIVDLGSNSLRLVIYAAADRPLDKLVNEKAVAGLGRIGADGRLPADGRARALEALARFRGLASDAGVDQVHAFATAAVRDAIDGADFLSEVAKLGIGCEMLDGQREAELAAQGVLAGFPDAHGLVADLGGGSLDLAWVGGGACGGGVSMPLGVLRIGLDDRAEADAAISDALATEELKGKGSSLPLYLVGGSFRTLARIDRTLAGRTGEKVQGYVMAPDRAEALVRALAGEHDRIATEVEDPRLATSPIAAMLLDILVEQVRPQRLVASRQGVREGFLATLAEPLAIAGKRG